MQNVTIQDLLKIVSPPDKPRHALAHSVSRMSWERCQQELAIVLPDEWRQIAEHYGSGSFRDKNSPHSFICIYNPLSPNFRELVIRVCDEQRETEEFHGQHFELHPFFPDDGGYFPVGEDDCENTFWYRTSPMSQVWPIVVWGGFGSGRVREFQISLIEFLVQLFNNDISLFNDVKPPFQDGVHFVADKRQ